MLAPFVAALVVQAPTAYPRPMPPRVHVRLVGGKPRLRVTIVPNHNVKKHPVVLPAVTPNPNA